MIFAKKSKKEILFEKNDHPLTWTPKKILFQKIFIGDYLRVGLHEYHNENTKDHFRFFGSVDSYRNRHLRFYVIL